MAVRKIIKIDQQKCDGCGQCIVNCPEGALKIVDGVARLVKEIYCDGLGACIGTCPLDAITIEEREAEAFDAEAVEKQMAGTTNGPSLPTVEQGCPGTAARQMECVSPSDSASTGSPPSQLSHWPVQLTLVPPNAPFLQGADLLLVADCVPFAMADFHRRLLRGRPVVVGCPKLDDPQPHVGKLAEILQQSSVRSLTIIHMEVPCCKGLCQIGRMAMEAAGRNVPVREVTVSVEGRVIAEEDW